MVSRYVTFTAALALVLATGAGCLNFGRGSDNSSATGGLWVSTDAGRSWGAHNVLPTAEGVNSISVVDVYSLEQDPSDASVLYLGTLEHGLFVSYDGSASWQRFEEEATKSGAILGVEVDPRNVCTFYVLKKDRLLKTTTCGREFDTQAYVETRSDAILKAMALDWYNPNVIWLGTSEGDVLKSSDGAKTWATNYRTKGDIVDIEVSNADSRVILVATSRRGLYRSADSGTTWVSFAEQLENFKNGENVFDFAQTADGKTLLMSSEYGILKSTDNGSTWASVPLVTASGEVTVRAIDVAPENGDVMYYGTGSTFYRSTSGGSAWSTADLPSTRGASVIHVDAADATNIFLGVRTLED